MISKDMQKVLDGIQSKRDHYNSWAKCLKEYTSKVEDLNTSIQHCRDAMSEDEIEIDKLQLQLRRIMNGEKSTIAVEPPRELEPVQIGRED